MGDKEKVKIDFITHDGQNDEYVMYLVEEGPWNRKTLADRMRSIQARVYKAVDAAVDGHLARAYPESRGRKLRIQVDLHGEPPNDVEALVLRLAKHITQAEEYVRDIEASDHVVSLRIVTKRL